MSGFVDDPDHFWRWAGCRGTGSRSRDVRALPRHAARRGARRVARGVRARPGARDRDRRRRPGRHTRSPSRWGRRAARRRRGGHGDRQRAPGHSARPCATLAASGDPRFVRDPWAGAALEAVTPGETVLIVGPGHTAMDLAASVIRARDARRVVAVSRRELPRSHEDPWRPRPPTPLFKAAELATWPEPIEEAMRRIRPHPDGWRQGLDSLRPIHRDLWLALDEPTRRRFVTEHRRDWEIHRSRISARGCPRHRRVDRRRDARDPGRRHPVG